MKIESTCPLESYRRFIIISTCKDCMPRRLMEDPQVFPERGEPGLILVEAKDKESLLTIGEIRFVKVDEVDRIIYNSKSSRTRLEWKRLREDKGKVVGDASLNSLVNLATTKVLGE